MNARFFRSREAFAPPAPHYRILPFRFMRWTSGEVFVSNDVGEWTFLRNDAFQRFAEGTLGEADPAFRELKAKHFLTDSSSGYPLQFLATKYRTKKAFLDGFTRLHMFVVTLRCDHTCGYCQVSRVTADRTAFDMTRRTATRAVEFMLRSPAPHIKVEFQGGESLLNFELIQFIVEAVELKKGDRDVEYVIATNLSEVSDEMLAFCAQHHITLSTSLDGPELLHNANRPRPGADSYQRTVTNIARAREKLGLDGVSALMTTTVESLRYPVEIVDEYERLGFDGIFVRPISPYGFAIRTHQAFRYEMTSFLDFYRAALERIIDWNRKGRPLIEVYAQILLRKMLTPFPTGYVDLQSPAGAGISAVVYNYDGDVYASDEGRMLAEMGDRSFRLGNLHTDTYESVMGGDRLRSIVEQSCSETMPGCSECALMPFCGSDPVFHWATQGDLVGHRPTSAFCQKNMAILKHLFDLIRNGDDFTRQLLVSWAVA